jgi:hypothetical protein
VKKTLLILIFTLIITQGKAQLLKKPVIFETRLHTGMNFPFYGALNYLVKDNIYAFDLALSFPTFGEDYWEKLYRYPRTGIGCSYWSLGNDDVFGRAYALYTYINIPFFKPTEKLAFNYQVSLGGAFLPKIFDVSDNPLNRAIGSHTNIYIRLGIDGKIKIFPRCEMVIEAGAMHCSNGKTKSPNYGINAGTFSLGFNYLLYNNPPAINAPKTPEVGKKYAQSVVYSAGSKVYDNLLGTRYFVSSVTYNFERYLSIRRRIGLGADLFYDGSINEALSSSEGVLTKDFTNLIKFGIHGSYGIRYKKLKTGIQVGYYLYSKYTDLTNIYSRISIQYLMTKNIFGSIGIKTHFGKADFLEWGIGYTW